MNPQRPLTSLSARASHVSRRALGALALGVAALTMTGPLHADAPPGRYALRACGTVVFDTQTKLEWQRGVNPPADVANAIGVCGALALDGGRWRAPTMLELSSIQDLTASPSIDQRAFPGTPSTNFATVSQSAPATPPSYWVLSFGTGVPDLAVSTTPGALVNSRCVRSAP
ncbi:MAG TPA: DUF1566 domain-containing protein [Polyangiaceae bacterium]|jgi:hypothetical protein|nr:DUF1566 domain-containing protein [Polyangiaceae bacterium]